MTARFVSRCEKPSGDEEALAIQMKLYRELGSRAANSDTLEGCRD